MAHVRFLNRALRTFALHTVREKGPIKSILSLEAIKKRGTMDILAFMSRITLVQIQRDM